MSAGRRAARRVPVAAALLAATAASLVSTRAPAASPGRARVRVDATAVRFVAPESGGPARPFFITERQLAFEARVERMVQDGGDARDDVDDRHVHAAIDHHVARELLVKLPHETPPKAEELAHVVAELREAIELRVGGRAALVRAGEIEGISEAEIDELVWREALAALYVDRLISPILRPTDVELREAYRTADHPFRDVVYEEARERLRSWVVLERVRVAEAAFVQSGRSRVTITYVVPELASFGSSR